MIVKAGGSELVDGKVGEGQVDSEKELVVVVVGNPLERYEQLAGHSCDVHRMTHMHQQADLILTMIDIFIATWANDLTRAL